jgi:ribosome-binding factor A
MAKEFNRTQRLGDFMRQELAKLIQFEVRDPRVGGMVSITDVQIAKDLSHAKVYVTVLGKENVDEAAESIAALNHAGGFLRSALAKINYARTTPKLRFVFDESIGRGARISKLIDDALTADHQQHAASPESTVSESESSDTLNSKADSKTNGDA